MERKINVMMKEVEPHRMFLHEEIGKGTTAKGDAFTVVRTVPAGSLVLEIGGKRWKVDTQELIKEMVEGAEHAEMIAKLEKKKKV